MTRQQGTDFDTVRTNNRSDRPRISDKVNLFKFPEKKWVGLRLVGPLFSYASYWCKADAADKGSKAKRFNIPSPSYDPQTQTFDSTKYDPWYEISQEQTFDKDDKDARNKQLVQIERKYYINAILRAAQKQQPSKPPRPTKGERECGFKDKDSDTWTPYVPVAMPPGLAQKIKELTGLNVVESKNTGASKAYSIAHDKYGCDIRIYYDNDKAPADKYQVQIGSRRALTEEEKTYLMWDLSELVTPASETENRREFEGWAKRMGLKTNKKRKHEVEEFDDEDIEEDMEDDEDEDTPKPKKKDSNKKSKRKAVEEDEDEDDEEEDDFDDEDEDEDDEPPKSKKKSSAKKTSKKSKKVEEEDEDFDDEDEDDEPVKKKSKSKVVEDEDEDDDLDDEDEEEEPVKKKSSKKPAKKSKRKAVEEDEDEDDEEEDDFDDEDEDEDDEPPKSKKKSSAKKKKR